MARIEILSLGGVEDKKINCYAVTIDENIFIFNYGIYVNPSAQLGIKKIIPDIN
jgi:mRNA degradation ribonuclease J1/J2